MSVSQPTAPSRSLLPIFGGILMMVAVLLLLYVAYLTVRPVLPSIVIAAAVASLASRLYQWAVRRLHGRKRLAASLSVLFLFIGVLVPFGLLVTFIVQRLVVEGMQLANNLQGGGPLSIDRIAASLGTWGEPLQRGLHELRPKIAAAVPQLAGHLGSFLATASRAALNIGIGMFLLAVALYYFFVDGDRWRERFVKLVPLPPEDTCTLLDQFHRVSVAVLVGNFGTAVAQASAATLGYFLFGAPVPLIWGAATLFAALIPVVGPALVWLPVSLAVGVDRGWLRGGGLALYGLLVVSTIDNIVRPLLTRRGLHLHPLLVFVAVFGGVISFGFAGLFLGPLIVALLVAALEAYERHVAAGERVTR